MTCGGYSKQLLIVDEGVCVFGPSVSQRLHFCTRQIVSSVLFVFMFLPDDGPPTVVFKMDVGL